MESDRYGEIRVARDGVVVRVRAGIDALPEAEQRVARFVAERPEDAVRLPVEALAREIGVSKATVVRCCQSLGYQGIRDLKLALATETLVPLQAIHEDVLATDDWGVVARKVLKTSLQAIVDTLATLDEAAFARAGAALLDASRIEFYGIGSSASVASDAGYRFQWIGMPSGAVTDPFMQMVSAAQLPPGAVAFAISHSGRSIDTINAMRTARDAGATCVVLSSHANTPLARLADIRLVTAARETALRTEAQASRLAHLAVLDALYVAVATRRFTESIDALDRVGAIVAKRLVD